MLFFTNICAGSTEGSETSPSNWTGLVDLEEDDTLHSMDACETNIDGCGKDCMYWPKIALILIHLFVPSATDPWSSESTGSYVTLQLIPGQNSLDWGEPLEPGPDSEEFLRPPVHPTPTEKKVGLVLSFCHEVWNNELVRS